MNPEKYLDARSEKILFGDIKSGEKVTKKIGTRQLLAVYE